MTDAAAFVTGHLGRAWSPGKAGPDVYDCWGWAKTVQREVFGRHIEAIPAPPADPKSLVQFIKEHAARRQWLETATPVHGGLVEMAHSSRPFHIGVYLDVDGGGITHASPGSGVTFDTILALRASGWRRLTFHDWIGADSA